MSSNSVCNHTRDKQIGLPLRGRYHSYDYRPNWTPLSPITITNQIHPGAPTRHRAFERFD